MAPRLALLALVLAPSAEACGPSAHDFGLLLQILVLAMLAGTQTLRAAWQRARVAERSALRTPEVLGMGFLSLTWAGMLLSGPSSSFASGVDWIWLGVGSLLYGLLMLGLFAAAVGAVHLSTRPVLRGMGLCAGPAPLFRYRKVKAEADPPPRERS